MIILARSRYIFAWPKKVFTLQSELSSPSGILPLLTRAHAMSSRLFLLWLILFVPASCGQEYLLIHHEAVQGAVAHLRPEDVFGQWPDPGPVAVAHPDAATFFEALQDSHDFNGTVLIAQGDRVIHSGAYGEARLEGDTLSLATPFQLASVSKMFTAVAIMQLAEAGKLAYDDPVQRYLPTFPYPDLSLRHLLQHRSGLARYMALADSHWDRNQVLRAGDVAGLFAAHGPDLWFEPGTDFNYSNSNYALLAAVVEAVAEQPFDQYLAEQVFGPLGMAQAGLYAEPPPEAATGYKRYRRGYWPAGHDYLDGVWGDKGVYASVEDLYRFERAFFGGRLLSAATLETALDPGEPAHPYGFGWRLRADRPEIVYHFGWWRGYRTCFIKDRERDITLLLLSNRDHLRHNLDFWYIFDQISYWIFPI